MKSYRLMRSEPSKNLQLPIMNHESEDHSGDSSVHTEKWSSVEHKVHCVENKISKHQKNQLGEHI